MFGGVKFLVNSHIAPWSDPGDYVQTISGRGVDGVIGHTQPRRVAARTIAARVADELGSELGDDVGFSVRFTDQVGDGTLVRVMTDGILLAEIQRDRMLRRYDTLIIDEAHERSLNIDFILGYVKELLPRRPDLKVIVTSATIDTERFAEHFDAPVIEVSGRTYPVELRYRPFGMMEHALPYSAELQLAHWIARPNLCAIGELEGCPTQSVLASLNRFD